MMKIKKGRNMKLRTKINRFRSSNPEYMKRIEELKRKENVRYNRQCGKIVSKKCRVHGKRRKERCTNALNQMTPVLQDRFIKWNWHSEMVGEYNYFGNRWQWVLDIEYLPLH